MMEEYSTIRDVIGEIVGQSVVDVTQHDKEHWDQTGESFVEFLFANGATLRFVIADDESRFEYDDGKPE